MKNRVYQKVLLIMAIALGVWSCNEEEFLDTPPPQTSDSVFFANDAAALSALAGVYDPIGWYNSSQLTEWVIGDTASDDAEKGGGGDGDYAELLGISKFNANAENPVIALRWEEFYIGINRANKLIEGITDNKNISDENRKRILAEAKFLRGYYYFNLVKTFGGVPLITKVLKTPEEYLAPRNTEAECWAQIESDFKAGAAGLPKKSQLGGEFGRATWGAATAMLAKTYVFQAKWKEANEAATAVVNSGEYQLEPDYGRLFIPETDNGVESVWDIQFKDLKMTGWADDHEGSHLEIITRSRDSRNGGWGFNQPTQDLYDEFEDGDIRREWTIISDGDVLFSGTADEEVIYTKRNSKTHPHSYTDYHRRKGTLPKSLRGNGEDQAGLNVRVIRYADVLLWQAEARAHLGEDWQTPLNEVRARVDLPATTETDGLKAVYHERRVELAMEGHRYWDLVRTGRGNLMKDYKDNKRYFLIPQKEILINPNLKQNPY